jgi:SPP1 family predicted phage head-tail adaptor
MGCCGNEPAGAFNVPCVIQVATVTKDTRGSRQESWATFWTGRAKVRTKYGSEREQASGIDHLRTKVVTIRYVSGVLPNMRVVLSGTSTNNIKYINNINEENKYIEITVQENL